MNIGIQSVDIVKKNSNDFSFSKEIIDEVINEEFKLGAKDFYYGLSTGQADTPQSYIWNTLSAVTDEVGEVLYQNVLNYINNIADIDTCTTKALQSMVKILGTRYNILDGIDDIPLELVNLLDVYSMRRECLLNSKIVCQQLVQEFDSPQFSNEELQKLNDYRSTMLSDNEQLSAPLSMAQYVDVEKMDKLMADAYRSTILHFLSLPYGKMTEDKPIVEVLSDNILLSNFTLPNKFQNKIDEYKVRWHISPEYNQEDAIDDIEAGLSTMDDYQQKYQGLLSIEYEREIAPLNKLEPMTRYAFFKEKKVKEYYNFVQNQYMQLYNAYKNATEYDVDSTYLNVTGKNATPIQLLNDDGKSFRTSYINAVALNLVNLTHKIQDLREYLKSHAQRTYMKGTFLLISYAVNEYLKQNVYPTMQQLQQTSSFLSVKVDDGVSTLVDVDVPQLEYNTDENLLRLTEYIDQTQYFNIQTDVDDLSTANFKTLNGKFWENENTTNGVGTFVDSTNVLKPASKSQIVFSRSMPLDKISEFYERILPKPNNALSSGKSYVNNFLTTVFATGADDSWWNDSYNKVMATLSDQTHTVDIDNYIHELSVARYSSTTKKVLDGYSPADGLNVKMQLDDAKQNYIDSLSVDCDDFIQSARDLLESKLKELDDILAQLETYHATFENIESRCNTLYSMYATFTTGFVQDKDYLIQNLEEYINRARFNKDEIDSQTIIGNIISQSDAINSKHAILLRNLQEFCKNTQYISNIQLNYSFDIHNISKIDMSNIVVVKYSTFSKNSNALTSNIFEISYDSAYNTIQKAKADLAFLIENILQQLNSLLERKLDSIEIEGFDKLSQLLSSYDFYNATFNILSTVDAVSAELDYSKNEWYKYKTELFMKYTGQPVGKTPFYYHENVVHPSYQIHPCLSNFIEKVDFSYPILNLGGIADNVLQQYEGSIIDSLLTTGYLTGMWKNYLNSNADYIVRYEAADHIDSSLKANEYFGWDGLIHPKMFTTEGLAPQGNPDQLVVSRLSNVLSGQNLMEDEIDKFIGIAKYYTTGIYQELSNYDIQQYGLDQYGNSYILLSGNDDQQLNGTLWFKPKNIPIPFLAFAYSDDSMNEEYMDYCAFSDVSVSNTSFKDAQPASIQLGTATAYAPKVLGFNFTQDNTMLFVNCKKCPDGSQSCPADFIVFGKIQQVKDTTVPMQWLFLQDLTSRVERLYRPTDEAGEGYWKFKSWFTQRTQFGAIYIDDHLQEKCDVCVSKFDRQLTHLTSVVSASINTEFKKSSSTEVFADCDVNGEIAIAYDAMRSVFSGKQATLPSEKSKQYIGNILATDGILSTYCETSLDSIQTYTLQVAGNSMFISQPSTYKPMQDAGFILATDSTVLSGTGYIDELENNKVLKFQLAVPETNPNAGIDFRHVCPIRQVESYLSADASTYTDSKSYHYSNAPVPLSGVLTSFSNVHFLESAYNQYLATLNDEQYYELADVERFCRKMPDKQSVQADLDYLQLAHYDVAKYLSALKSESEEFNSYDDNYISEQLRHKGLISPYMMVNGYVPSTYEFGLYIAGSDQVQDAFKTNRTQSILSELQNKSAVITLGKNEQLSVQWMNRNGQIKLDFNTALYLKVEDYSSASDVLPSWQKNFTHVLSGQTDNRQASYKFNERNKRSMFLNLDQPGEAGILNTWEYKFGGVAHVNTWLVKNISEGNTPKFILAKVSKEQLENSTQLAGVQFNKAIMASSIANSSNDQTYLLAAEGLELRYIAFE